jgi:hypothetical protein
MSAVTDYGILVIHKEEIVLSTDNLEIIGPTPAIPFLAALLMDNPRIKKYVTGINLYPCFAKMNDQLQTSVPGWKCRFSARKRVTRVLRNRRYSIGVFFPDYVAIDRKGPQKNERFPRARIDILNLDLLEERPALCPVEQLFKAQAIIELQLSRGIKSPRLTKGAIGSALLRKSPNWEDKRHAAPRFVNQTARDKLPGNYYSISRKVAQKKERFFLDTCYYIDQSSSHHSIAVSTKVPHPHYIRGRGRYKAAMVGKMEYYPIWCHADSTIGQELISNRQTGLVLVKVYLGQLPPTKEHLYPPWAKKRGKHYLWLWTPELRLFLSDKRLQLDSFVAGFTSHVGDPAIAEYGKWALDYLQNNPRYKQHTKGVLLSTYGMLAFNPEKYKKVIRYWGGNVRGNRTELPEAGTVSERQINFKGNVQHSLVNVIARGIIEAETRTRSLEYAKELDEQGYHVPQIYADGIVVETHQLPFIKNGWRVAHELTHVQIPRANAILSDQITKLPGMPYTEDDMRFIQRREEARQPIIRLNKPLDRVGSLV